MVRWLPRSSGRPDALKVLAAAAGLLLAFSSPAFLVWALLTPSTTRFAWMTSISNIAGFALAGATTSAALLAWARHSRTTAPAASLPTATGHPRLIPLAEADPFDLEVKRPLAVGSGQRPVPSLPPYVRRDHDVELTKLAEAAAAGESRLAVIVGRSSTGKTRAGWEMLEPLRAQTPAWRLWRPIEPSPPAALLAGLSLVKPRTVVWLNEAHAYLDTPDDAGERAAAGLRELVNDPARGPVLIVATLWPEVWDTLTDPRRTPEKPDLHSQARELLFGCNFDVPAAFSAADLDELKHQAVSDPRLAEAAARAPERKVIQYLAGVPVLMDRYRHASVPVKALIHAAMDARRMGYGRLVPRSFLADAAPGYMTGDEWDQFGADDWLVNALNDATRPLGNGIDGLLTQARAGKRPGRGQGARQAGLRRQGPAYRLADYLDQYGRQDRQQIIPPLSFWDAAVHGEPANLLALAHTARRRGLLRPAALLNKQAAGRSAWAASQLASIMHDCDHADQRPAWWAVAHAPLHQPDDVVALIGILDQTGARQPLAGLLARSPAAHASLDDPHAVANLLYALDRAGAREQADILATRAARHVRLNNPYAIADLLDELHKQGAMSQTEAIQTAILAERAARDAPLDDPHATGGLLSALHDIGAQELAAIFLSRDPAAHAVFRPSDTGTELLHALRKASAREQAAALARRAALDAPLDHPYGVASLLSTLLELEDQTLTATVLSRDPAGHVDVTSPTAVSRLLHVLQEASARDQAYALAMRAARHANLDSPDETAALLKAVHKARAQEPAALLASRAARETSLSDPRGLLILLDALRATGAGRDSDFLLHRAIESFPGQPATVPWLVSWMLDKGMREQAVFLAGKAATDGPLEDLMAVANMLRILRRIDTASLTDTLLARSPASSVALDTDRPHHAEFLLREFHKAGAGSEARLLISRLPAGGMFDLFCAQNSQRALYRFGRDPDGSPTPPWGWDDLDQ